MRIYLVGGAVRDCLLGLEPGERDWVVTGATPEDMLELGYRAIDPAFPVFLHPQTGDEYALARRERKSGQGYRGFEFDAGPGVSLEEDLARRDLTINAIAQDETGQLVDPYGGQTDLHERRLRHVTPAFVEDPLRVLRLARFTAQLARFDFEPDPATDRLARRMSEDEDLLTLTASRRWRELERSLRCDDPGRYLVTLSRFGALHRLMPWLAAPGGAVTDGPSPAQALTTAAAQSPDPAARLTAACFAAAAAGATGIPPGDWPLPREIRDTITAGLRNPLPDCSDAAAVLGWLELMDAWRREERLERVLRAWSAAAPERRPETMLLRHVQEAARGARPPEGAADPRAAVRAARLAAVSGVLGNATGAPE